MGGNGRKKGGKPHKNFTLKKVGDNKDDTKSKDQIEIGVSSSSSSYNISRVSVLPVVILLEIFLRLPISVILRCKLVCTEWYKLLYDSTFICNYSRTTPFTHYLVPVIISNPSCPLIYLLEISENWNCIQTVPIKPKLPGWLDEKSSLEVIGSCNGLLCIRVYRPGGVSIVHVCNPITGEYVSLPSHGQCSIYSGVHYEFGFIPSTANLKVLTYEYLYPIGHRCDIFTVGVDDRWRSIDIPLIDEFFQVRCISFNGVLHWIQQVDDEDPFYIHIFDLADEKNAQMAHPPDVVMEFQTMDLVLLHNQFCLVDYSIESQFTIWKMKEYGNVHSWIKDVIQMSWFPSGMHYIRLCQYGGLQSEDILFVQETDLVSFNIKQKKCSIVFNVGSIQFIQLHNVQAYAPSFSSLDEVKANGQWRSMINI